MCGRYVMALRPSQVRRMLEADDMPVDDAPEDEGDDAPRQSYNFAPGSYGIVYRADVPDHGAGPAREHGNKSGATTTSVAVDSPAEPETEAHSHDTTTTAVHYKLQSMKWGLVPFWTKRKPDYGATLKTINCRDDSLATPGGLWTTMKARKRCIVVAQGFYEWLHPAKSKDKIPHYVKRADGKLMYFAGLWDCAQYETEDQGEGSSGKKLYTYTVITTESNKQLRFLHDRMPVILEPGSDAMKTWLDPARWEWSGELQRLLRPFEGQLEVYPVSKEVGKVGNNSPSFVIPVASRENKRNIANFFAKPTSGKGDGKGEGEVKDEIKDEVEVKKEEGGTETKTVEEVRRNMDDGGMGVSSASVKRGVKREAGEGVGDDLVGMGAPPEKKPTVNIKAEKRGSVSPSPSPKKQGTARPKISATSNVGRSPTKKGQGKGKVKAEGSQKITKFFGNSA
ncbi:hypothetical protein B0T19DRAFT_101824 [Cercophora scortea]|uniref:DUF159-domain-containing protein n=1 Tax=Cercophora scortea TaxID=314031 RepID=A0AAE0IWF7_9PEZI|nr:hypothetical protein B0T19DRAFT_101824 [Cercophora scortea]